VWFGKFAEGAQKSNKFGGQFDKKFEIFNSKGHNNLPKKENR
jgi:hypothetical protein